MVDNLNDQARKAVDKVSPRTTLARQEVIQKFSVNVCQWHGKSSIRVVAASPKNRTTPEIRSHVVT
jgi:hypothetical protein